MSIALLLLTAQPSVAALLIAQPSVVAAYRLNRMPRRCAPMQLSAAEPMTMRAAEIKAELTSRKIDFADCFDKESLADKLTQARAGLLSPPPPPPPPTAQAPTPGAPPPANSVVEEVMAMRASQIKAELKERRIEFGDCFDKESLVDKLVQARTGQIRPAPVPPPRGAPAGGNFEYGAESRLGEEDASMEEAFRAAGWTGKEESDPSKVDEGRSPGMNRNFADMDIGDFKQPYSGGSSGSGRKSRYAR